LIKRINHIGIVVRRIEEALKVYQDALGLPLTKIEEVPEQEVRVAFLEVDGSEVELIEPTSTKSGVARFLERRGEGLHHICFKVDDIEGALSELEAKGISLVDREPRRGAKGKVAFIHPRSACGVLIELLEVV
jgi:methylmalonyl-CoA epimerase